MKDNTNALKVTLIIFVILMLIEGAVIYSFYSQSETMKAQTNDAVGKAQSAQKSEQDAKMQMLKMRELIGQKDDADLQRVQDDYNKDMALYAKALGQTEQNYRRALANLWNELGQKNDEHKTTQDKLLETEANNKSLNAQYETVLKKYTDEKEKAVAALNKAKQDYASSIAKNREELASVAADKTRIEQESADQIKKANAETEKKTLEANETQLVAKKLQQMKHDLTRVVFDTPNGEVVAVNQHTKEITINLGEADGLRPRMTFSVYPPTITGISFGSADPDAEANLCDVCKRDRSLNASKASIEVTKIEGPHKAKARVLDDVLTNPIVSGDVIYTPIWKPGQKQHFAFAAGIKIPGIGRRDGGTESSDLDTMKQLVSNAGGVVDAYISEGNDGHKRGEMVGEINPDTTFVVIGDVSEKENQDQEMMEAQSKMKKAAEQYAVKMIGLKQFLTLMGYKNPTPIRGFGDFAADGDTAIMPRGGQVALGTVSPIYTPRNDSALVSNEDRPKPTAPGTVSGMYQHGKVPATASGNVSDIFRPRRPSSSQPKE